MYTKEFIKNNNVSWININEYKNMSACIYNDDYKVIKDSSNNDIYTLMKNEIMIFYKNDLICIIGSSGIKMRNLNNNIISLLFNKSLFSNERHLIHTLYLFSNDKFKKIMWSINDVEINNIIIKEDLINKLINYRKR